MRTQPYKHLMNTWTPLLTKRFRCGHEKTEANTLINRYGDKETKRCRCCHNANNHKYKRAA